MATIEKRNNTYRIIVACGYDVTGKQIRRRMTYKPEAGMTTKQIEKEVQRQAVLFEEQCNNGTAATDGRIKLADYVPIYLENVKNSLSPTVYTGYIHIIESYINPMLGHFKLKDIKPVHVQKFVNQLETCTSSKSNHKLAGATIRRYYTVLQAILHSAYRLEIIGVNPADSDRITLPKTEEQKTEIFTQEEVETILDYLESEPLQFKLLIHMALNTGCRRGELVGLKWSDVNFRTGVLTVSRSNYKLTGDTEIRSKATKTGKSREIILPPYMLAMLKQFRAEQAQTQLLIGDKWQGDNWVFTQADGKPMYPTTPTQKFSRFLKHNGLQHRKFHALRHTSATLLLSNGTNIKNVASRLGHAEIRTTNRYVHAIEEADRQAANTFETLFNTDRKRA